MSYFTNPPTTFEENPFETPRIHAEICAVEKYFSSKYNVSINSPSFIESERSEPVVVYAPWKRHRNLTDAYFCNPSWDLSGSDGSILRAASLRIAAWMREQKTQVPVFEYRRLQDTYIESLQDPESNMCASVTLDSVISWSILLDAFPQFVNAPDLKGRRMYNNRNFYENMLWQGECADMSALNDCAYMQAVSINANWEDAALHYLLHCTANPKLNPIETVLTIDQL